MVEPAVPAPQAGRRLLDVLTAVGLVLCLGLVYALDTVPPPVLTALDLPAPPPPPDPPPLPPPSRAPLKDENPRVDVRFNNQGRFGLVTKEGKGLKLTYAEDGRTNNTCLWVNGEEEIFGRLGLTEPVTRKGRTTRCACQIAGILVEQEVELIGGDVSGLLDTLRITYRLKNTTDTAAMVGLRVMIDTFIGDNDGVPFLVVGRNGGVFDKPVVFQGEGVPELIRALQRQNPENPGVVVNIAGLRPENGEAPEEAILTAWPRSRAGWDYPRDPPFAGDSALGLYYKKQTLPAGADRVVSFTYGLGSYNSGKQLSLTAATAPQVGRAFRLLAMVAPTRPNQTLHLELPQGLQLGEGEAERPVSASRDADQLQWIVRVDRGCPPGTVEIRARLRETGKPDMVRTEQFTILSPESTLQVRAEPLLPGQRGFWVTANVGTASTEHRAEIRIVGPPGVRLDPGHAARKPLELLPGKGNGYAQWLILVDGNSDGEVKLDLTLTPGAIRDSASVTVRREIDR